MFDPIDDIPELQVPPSTEKGKTQRTEEKIRMTEKRRHREFLEDLRLNDISYQEYLRYEGK